VCVRDGLVQVLASLPEAVPSSFCVVLPAVGEVLDMPDAGWRIRVSELDERQVGIASGPGAWPASACLSLPSSGKHAVWVRSWEAGDRYQPIGLAGGSKKLQDLFTDSKVPVADRWRIPLVGCDDTILWVAGGEVALAGAVTEKQGCLQVFVEAIS